MLYQSVIQFISALIFVYLLLIGLRIMLTWFQGPSYGKAWLYLNRITEPYLRLFREIKFLRVGSFDFSPIAGILVLIIIQNILNTISIYKTISLGLILAIVVQSAWHSATWVFLFFIVLCGVRLAGLYWARTQEHPLWKTLDLIVQPLIVTFQRIVRRSLNYGQSLFGCIASLALIWLLGGFLIGIAVRLLFLLPL
ncbi:MAG TPA: YggT family protein [Spirochaetia bacterium]|nr:YggT family protein [Spirochaetia bacterium]